MRTGDQFFQRREKSFGSKHACIGRIQATSSVGGPSVSLVGGELVEARGLGLVLPQAATAVLVEVAEIGLPASVSLVGGELIETCGLVLVLRQTSKAAAVIDSEIDLRCRVSLVCGELVEACGLALILRQAATAIVVH